MSGNRPVLAVLVDASGNISEILEDNNGLLPEPAIGTPFSRVAASGSLAKALSFITQIQKEGFVFDWEFSVVMEGGPRPLHFTGGRVGNNLLVAAAGNGSVSLEFYEEMMRINNDQTNALRKAYAEIGHSADLYDEVSRLNNELMDIQRQLAKSNAQLAQLNEEKNRFLGVAAHDLRNPLHSILLLSEFLLDDIHAEELRELIFEIRNSSQFMAKLLDDLLDVAKIESGGVKLDYTPVDMNQLAQHNVQRNQVLAQRKDVRLELEGHLNDVVIADEAKLEQMLNNLITNAVKFSPEGSRVLVRLIDADTTFVCQVQDWGSGIPPEIQEHLFTPFRKGQTGTAGEKSTGLGLTIVKRIVEAHRGTIEFESVPGEGTIFTVTIPCEPNS